MFIKKNSQNMLQLKKDKKNDLKDKRKGQECGQNMNKKGDLNTNNKTSKSNESSYINFLVQARNLIIFNRIV